METLHMSDRLSRITKNIIRGGTAVAIGASAWACEKGYIVPDSVQTKTPITELVPPPTSTETISNEKISRYGQFEIGEVKIGVISDLKIQTNPDLNIVNKVKDLALLSIPEAKDKEISINIYDMIGDKGTAPFITASVNDSNGNLEFAYVGFSLDENNIQRPPIDGDVDIFYPLRVVEQEDKSVFIGIPDQTTQNLQTPIMFYIDQNNDTYFYPPYTDYLAQNDTTYGGLKVQAMLLKPEDIQIIETGSELNKLGMPEGAKLGEENGKSIYYVTNQVGETVTVGIKNEKGKWELADSVKYKLVNSKEEALNNVFDYDFVMRGGPGEIAKLTAEPFPEDVITGLNVIVATPNYLNYEVQPYNYLYYDQNGKNIIKRNPGKEPYRNMGWFSFVNEAGQQGNGTVWQWINPDKSIVYLTTVGYAGVGSELVATPFVIFNVIVESPNFTTGATIGKNPNLNKLIQQWADTDIIPAELQYHALMRYSTFNP